MEVVDWKDKIVTAVGGKQDTRVELYNQDKTTVFHFTGDGEETAIRETDAYNRLAEVVAVQPFTSRGACDVMDTLREESLLGGYYRGSGEFPEAVADALSRDWVSSENGWVEVDLDHMDHKRAMATVTCRVNTDVKTLLKAGDNQLVGWTASFNTDLGRLEVEC
jgi:hypothetical protein